ncbi:MAG: sugar ABC transporter permease [Rivularia sp. (in: cyanobacteria)]
MPTIRTSNIQLTISLSELDLDEEELQAEVYNLLPQIQEVDGVEEAGLVEVSEVPESSKSLSGYVLGMLKTVLVDKAHLKNVFGFLRDRFASKPETIKLLLKAPDGRELNLEASNEEDFASAMELAENFLNNTKSI